MTQRHYIGDKFFELLVCVQTEVNSLALYIFLCCHTRDSRKMSRARFHIVASVAKGNTGRKNWNHNFRVGIISMNIVNAKITVGSVSDKLHNTVCRRHPSILPSADIGRCRATINPLPYVRKPSGCTATERMYTASCTLTRPPFSNVCCSTAAVVKRFRRSTAMSKVATKTILSLSFTDATRLCNFCSAERRLGIPCVRYCTWLAR